MLENTPSANNKAPQRGKWLNDADEMLSYLERHDGALDNAHDTAFTAALLKEARAIISKSEERIAELERLSSTDELTGITNRRGFMRAFDRELDRVNRNLSQGGLLVMIDLDNFKMINDKHGHKAGDTALKVVASALATDIRLMDIVARLGGDEFVILFTNTTRKDALERAQFLIKKLNNLSFIWREEEVAIRASLGLKEYKKGSRAENIFNAADASMYENKKQIKQLGIRKQNTRMV